MTTTPCTGCAVQQGTHQPAEALHQQIDEPQSEALRLAAWLLHRGMSGIKQNDIEASNQLRWLHAESLQHKQELAAYRFTVANREARIAELESQFEAIGAGGVEPLRKPAPQAQAVQAAVPLPLLVRDIARDLGITVPQACIALKPLGNYSTNSAVTAEMARMLRDHFPAPVHPAKGVPAAIDPGECSQDVFDHGVSVGLFDIPKNEANAICAGLTAATGARVDWHYIAGRVHMKALAATQPAAQGMDARTAYEAECFRWLRDEALKVWKKGPVVFMTDADGCPGAGGAWSDNILSGEKLERAIPVAAQAKQGEQP